MGRRIDDLADVSRATGVHVIAATGLHQATHCDADRCSRRCRCCATRERWRRCGAPRSRPPLESVRLPAPREADNAARCRVDHETAAVVPAPRQLSSTRARRCRWRADGRDPDTVPRSQHLVQIADWRARCRDLHRPARRRRHHVACQMRLAHPGTASRTASAVGAWAGGGCSFSGALLGGCR
ncbi:hypothetical protein [Actinomadura sp. NPDC000929]|uniref:hypothetical protein n=1 Tax=Actinomadura sp. NPDC000929 TaxID=3154517 RepID=UPI00339090D5